VGITEAQKIATAKHKKTYYKRIPLDVKKEEYNELKKCKKNKKVEKNP